MESHPAVRSFQIFALLTKAASTASASSSSVASNSSAAGNSKTVSNSKASKSTSNNSNGNGNGNTNGSSNARISISGSGLAHSYWMGWLEQGLLPLLLCVQLGFPICQVQQQQQFLEDNQASEMRSFPEKSIRNRAGYWIDQLTAAFVAQPTLLSRLSSSLLHLGNMRLKTNLFLGILLAANSNVTNLDSSFSLDNPASALGR
jgi:hypothetical protein